jgi:periplasmic copper chaperone A
MVNSRSLRRLAPAALLALLLPAACDRHPKDKVWADHAWVRLAAAPGRPSAAYLSLHGADKPARLVALDAAAAGSAELHEMVNRTDTGPSVMAMERVDGIDIPAGAQVDLAPGGYHAMLFGLSPSVKPGDKLPLTVRLARGEPIRVEAKVVAAGDPAPY